MTQRFMIHGNADSDLQQRETSNIEPSMYTKSEAIL